MSTTDYQKTSRPGDLDALLLKAECIQAEIDDLAGLVKRQRDLFDGLSKQLDRLGEVINTGVVRPMFGPMCCCGCRCGQLAGARVSHESSPSVDGVEAPTVGERPVAGEQSPATTGGGDRGVTS